MNFLKRIRDINIRIEKIHIFCFILLTSFSFLSVALAEKVNDLKIDRYVNDFANVIDDTEESQLNKELSDFNAMTSNQIVVVTVNNLDGDYIESYGIKLAERIKAGSSKNDNGVILLFSKDDKKVRIEIGYGLEGSLTDSKSHNIINDIMVPEFKGENYTKGLVDGTHSIMEVVKQDNFSTSSNGFLDSIKNTPLINLMFIFFALFVLAGVAISWLASVLGRTKSWWLGGLIGFIISLLVYLFLLPITYVFLFSIIGFVFDYFVSKSYKEHKKTRTNPEWWAGGSWGPGGGFGGGYSGSSGGFGGGFGGGGGGFGGGGSSGSW
ncbi:MAG: uncharacterized protein QG614_409 [Patescibacteria group bacterium]|nr:uncharacterized protein [Patescibacteria group bacterium]